MAKYKLTINGKKSVSMQTLICHCFGRYRILLDSRAPNTDVAWLNAEPALFIWMAKTHPFVFDTGQYCKESKDYNH